MRKIICLLFAAGIVVLAKAQYTINCGNQVFTINAKRQLLLNGLIRKPRV
ncbi:MAG: hypothetical protein JNM14_01535 [Ferruginibacter sp.]|nr:hypothetical protein [Ferruginibacter sp.]